MKKKLLITLFVAIIMCLFAFSANAANEVTFSDGTKADFETVFRVGTSNNVNNVVLGFNSGYSKENIKDITFPDSISEIECNFMFQSSTSLKTLTFEATDTFFISGDNIFTKTSVEKITFNPDCVVEFRKGNFSGSTSLTEITFPKIGAAARSLFQDNASMVSTNDVIFAEGIKEIGPHIFNGCTSLTCKVELPASLTTIKEFSFANNGITHIDLSKCVNLETLTSEGTFSGCSLESIDFSACTKITTTGTTFFSNSQKLENVILPPNLQEVKHKMFCKCYALESIVLPASVETVADEVFNAARKNAKGSTFTIYIQGPVVFNTTYVFRDAGNVKVEFVLLGDSITVEQFKKNNEGMLDIHANDSTKLSIANATVVDYLDPQSPWTYVVGQTGLANHVIVANYCTYLAKTGDHSETDTICENNDYCADCNYLTCESHTSKTEVGYPNGYTKDGSKKTSCDKDNCNGKGTIVLKPIFKTLGYSIKNDGCGITNDYEINVDALNEYKEYLADNGKTFTFGVFIGNSEYFTGNTFVNADGTMDNSFSYIQAVNSLDYSRVKCTVADFTLAEKDLTLVMGIYVIDGGKVSYVQHEGTYEKEITKGDVTLDVVTITKIADLSGIDLALPETKALPVENKEN